jgi:hypothetical protein
MIDLAGPKVLAQTLGANRRAARWLLTPFGAFATAFPGFIVGYFTVENDTMAAAATVYAQVLQWAGCRWHSTTGTRHRG